ncbi:hypothetical protein M3Y98_00365500 [Aphelenchoides besseyi]|nr:hypothetical protein M3Y98_00365500 [Aphelenchoides besseyi]
MNQMGKRKKQTRGKPLMKTVAIRPMVLDDTNERDQSVKFSIRKDTLVNLIFGRSDAALTAERYEAAVYEYKNGRKLTFFPILFNSKTPVSYTCVDCFHVYAVMTAIRSRLDNLHCCKFEELNENANPLLFPHYCAHWDAMSKAQLRYFKEYAWHFNSKDHGDNLMDNGYAIGRYVKNLGAMDEKLTKFCIDNEGTDPKVLMNYVRRLDYTVKDEKHAESFLEAFKDLHKQEITYQNGLLFFEALPDSQGSLSSDSQTSNTGLLGRSTNKRPLYATPSTTLSQIQSLQANGLKNKRGFEANSQQLHTIRTQSINGISPTSSVCSSLKNSPDADIDVGKFITGLLLNAMNTVKNAELQFLYDGLRPLVAKYAPNQLSQFITMIHTIDRQMPNRLRNVELNTGANDWNSINETQLQSASQHSTDRSADRLSAFRLRQPKRNIGSSTNPIVVPDDPADEKTKVFSTILKLKH